MADQLKAGIPDKVLNIRLPSREKVVETNDFVTLTNQAIAKVGTEESGSAGDKNSHGKKVKGKKGEVKSLKAMLMGKKRRFTGGRVRTDTL
jgi:hypothetical protein